MSHTKALFTLNGAGDLVPATAEEIIASAREHLSRRVRRGASLSSPQAVRDFLAVKLGAREFESFCAIFLDARHRVIEFVELFRGTIDSAAVYPREVAKEALHRNAAALICAGGALEDAAHIPPHMIGGYVQDRVRRSSSCCALRSRVSWARCDVSRGHCRISCRGFSSTYAMSGVCDRTLWWVTSTTCECSSGFCSRRRSPICPHSRRPLWAGFCSSSTAGISPLGRQGRAGALRVLLRYLHRQGILASDLSRAVPRGRTYKHAAIPRAIPWSEIERVLASVDRRSAAGKRDYAALLLLSTYGLRSQEVAMLELSAIDWAGSRFHVLGRKAGNSTTYPLSAPVGEAIIDYLRNARPQCEDRHVFVSLTAPFRGVGHWAISGRASLYLRRAGIQVRRPGSHTFRHSCAQRLVEADVPFKQIGDYIGHRSAAATQVYAKVALHKLRALTLGEAEDVL